VFAPQPGQPFLKLKMIKFQLQGTPEWTDLMNSIRPAVWILGQFRKRKLKRTSVGGPGPSMVGGPGPSVVGGPGPSVPDLAAAQDRVQPPEMANAPADILPDPPARDVPVSVLTSFHFARKFFWGVDVIYDHNFLRVLPIFVVSQKPML
jgi:hypothetical protein